MADTKNANEETARHVQYEVDMLNQTFARLSQTTRQAGGAPTIEERAIFESFGVHCRIMLEFFDPRTAKPRPTDIKAEDFLDRARLESIKSRLENDLEPFVRETAQRVPKAVIDNDERQPVVFTRTLLDRRLAHLTRYRLGLMFDPEWRIGWLYRPLNDAWRAFLRALEPECRAWFDDPPQKLNGDVASMGATTSEVSSATSYFPPSHEAEEEVEALGRPANRDETPTRFTTA